jgi:tRNA A-37 threonylcarbamoyl transferase component Bud32
MAFPLSAKNVLEYLVEQGICPQSEPEPSEIEPKVAKNFNLLLKLHSGRKLLVKQERLTREGKTAGEFSNEWRIQEFLQRFSEISHIRPLLSDVLHFDANHSIIVFNYLDNYCDLTDVYAEKDEFPREIATSIGATLATIHRATLDHQEYQDFFSQNAEDVPINEIPSLTHRLERISPEIFGQVSSDGLQFLALYQRYDSLGKAIAELAHAMMPCCLTHNDLKLNNILLHNDWEQAISKEQRSHNNIIRLIDWERSSWGDPAFDLGTIITSYLQFWLGSLVVSKSIDINESLRLAMIPIEKIQPSITTLTQAYFDNFPEILERSPNFLRRVVQFSGLGLIHRIQAMLQYEKSFGNAGICMLQVAKTLLCRPEQSIPTIFGMTEAELTRLNPSIA